MCLTWVFLILGLLRRAQAADPTVTAAPSDSATTKGTTVAPTQKPTTEPTIATTKPKAGASTTLRAAVTRETAPPTTSSPDGGAAPPPSTASVGASPEPTTAAPSKKTKGSTEVPGAIATPTATPGPVATPSKATVPESKTPTSLPHATGTADKTESAPTGNSATTPAVGTEAGTKADPSANTRPTPSLTLPIITPPGATHPPGTTEKVPEGPTSGSPPIPTQRETTAAVTTVVTTTVGTTTLPTTTAPPAPFNYTYNKAEKDNILTKVCDKLLEMIIDGNCSIEGRMLHNGTHVFDQVNIYGKVNTSVVDSHYKEFQKETESEVKTETSEESDSTTLIAILASCGAVALIIVGLAIYTYRHGKSYRKNQQHLTEELQTVENGYHDNPTLEVMEVQQETAMEKRPNGEFNDSWIVPIDNLLKEELPDEEDTHL